MVIKSRTSLQNSVPFVSDWVKSKAPGPSVVPAAKEKPIAGLQVFPALVNKDSLTVIFLISKNI